MTARAQGWEGWDAYAPFYDWENARTVARRDVAFWQRLAAAQDGRGARARAAARDASPSPSSAPARTSSGSTDPRRCWRAGGSGCGGRSCRTARCWCAATSARCRSDPARASSLVMAPYGILQSLTRERDLAETLRSVARVVAARRALRYRSGAGSAALVGIQTPDEPRGHARRHAAHARRIGASGSPAPAHDLRSRIHRAARARAPGAPFLAHVPHAVGSPDGPASRNGRLPDPGGARRLPGRAVGQPGGRLGHPRAETVASLPASRFQLPVPASSSPACSARQTRCRAASIWLETGKELETGCREAASIWLEAGSWKLVAL